MKIFADEKPFGYSNFAENVEILKNWGKSIDKNHIEHKRNVLAMCLKYQECIKLVKASNRLTDRVTIKKNHLKNLVIILESSLRYCSLLIQYY